MRLCIQTPTTMRLVPRLHGLLDHYYWAIVDESFVERSYPTSDVVGGQIAIGLESVQANERGEYEVGECEGGPD